MAVKTTPFDGNTYVAELDEKRLTTNLDRTVAATRGGDWFSLERLAFEVGCSEAGVSARLRDLRKPKHAERYGVAAVESRRVKGGLWQYRVTYRSAT